MDSNHPAFDALADRLLEALQGLKDSRPGSADLKRIKNVLDEVTSTAKDAQAKAEAELEAIQKHGEARRKEHAEKLAQQEAAAKAAAEAAIPQSPAPFLDGTSFLVDNRIHTAIRVLTEGRKRRTKRGSGDDSADKDLWED